MEQKYLTILFNIYNIYNVIKTGQIYHLPNHKPIKLTKIYKL